MALFIKLFMFTFYSGIIRVYDIFYHWYQIIWFLICFLSYILLIIRIIGRIISKRIYDIYSYLVLSFSIIYILNILITLSLSLSPPPILCISFLPVETLFYLKIFNLNNEETFITKKIHTLIWLFTNFMSNFTRESYK